MKRQHKHAEMIRRWLNDDSLEVEIEHPHCPYWEPSNRPDWNENRNYRFKPKMIKCGDLEFPAPTNKPNVPAYSVNVGVNYRTFWIAGYHETEEAAEAHAKALIALTEVK